MERICRWTETLIHDGEQPYSVLRSRGRVSESAHIQSNQNRIVQVHKSIQRDDKR